MKKIICWMLSLLFLFSVMILERGNHSNYSSEINLYGYYYTNVPIIREEEYNFESFIDCETEENF